MKIQRFNILFRLVVAGLLPFGCGRQAHANPTGMSVQSGSASAIVNGARLTVTTSQNATLNWQSFNIAADETTIFNQPSVSSIVVNNIHDANASQIYGSLQANGIVVLINASGFYFGPNSFVKTGGLVLSTANCLPPQNAGGSWQFNGPPPLASIVNYGQIQVGNGGSAFLIADNVENHGTISAPDGSVGLASGRTVLLSDRPDGRGMSMAVTLPQGSVNNYGTIVADGGTIAMNAKVVNQNGLLQANSVRDVNGTIELVASDQLNLGANSQIIAHGDDASAGSSGGSVTLQSGNDFSDDVGSRIDVSGGSQGGNGGSVEISAPDILSLNSAVNAAAQSGWNGGVFALDPIDIVLGDTGATGPDANGTINGTSGSGVFYVDVDNAFQNITAGQILLEASGNIYVGDGTDSGGSFTPISGIIWNLTGSTGNRNSGQLTLQADGNIDFVDGSLITDANNWSVSLAAGYNFANNTIQPGTGNIYLNGGSGLGGSGSIQTAAGNINLQAGQDITVGSGYVITTGGGSISAHALAGNIDTGSDAQGYHFVSNASSLTTAYNLSDGLGGISTAAGGDVTLIAGGDVTSYLPGSSDRGDALTAGSGAYGPQSGNVTIVAGGNVTGNYVVANGYGSIYAGAEMDANDNPVVARDANNNPITEKDANGNPVLDASGNPIYVYALNPTFAGSAGTDPVNPNLALNLISGGWNVAAAQNILLQEVRNPNGDFNGSGVASHLFNYAANAYVDLYAGSLVQLGASASVLPRLSHANGNIGNVPVIYAPILNIVAGVGGIILGTGTSPTSLTLFPSSQGGLTINTSGSLTTDLNSSGGAPQLFNLIVSDAGHNQYTTTLNFGQNDHASSPVHLNNSTPLELNIAGDMQLINLVAPEAAQINVGGNMINCGFQGMNLSANPSFAVPVQEADGSTRPVTVDPGVTSINVTGDIYDRSAFTELTGVTPAEAANLFYLSESQSSSISAATLATSFYYNPTTETLTYQNINSALTLLNILQQLNNLPVQEYINGVPQYVNGDPSQGVILAPNPVSVLGNPTTPGTVAYALLAQYNALGAIPKNASTYGYIIGGGGQFNVTARTLDLGTSAGIQSEGVSLYTVHGAYPLASLFGTGGAFNHGADVKVTTTGSHSAGETANGDLIGDLDMFSSSIASTFDGNISINVGGDVNVGSPVFTVNSLNVRGIYTTSQGNLSIIAEGNIDCNGSRIVTYDGGNITVESLNGSVNTGSGASTPVQVTGFYENPVTHAVYTTSPQIPFSGIVALTFPARDASYPAPPSTLGNILVEAPNGDINANAAGILQIALNGLNYPDANVTVLAGYDLQDSLGNPVNAGDMADGTPVLVSADRDINVNGSGIIASNAKLDASGNINGFIFARNNIDIIAQQNISVAALGGGNVNVNSAHGIIDGPIIGVISVNVSGNSTADLISANVSGATSGQSGLGQGTAANATASAASSSGANQAFASTDQTDGDDKKKKKEVALAQKVSRVTVILPGKNSPPAPSPASSQKQTATQPL